MYAMRHLLSELSKSAVCPLFVRFFLSPFRLTDFRIVKFKMKLFDPYFVRIVYVHSTRNQAIKKTQSSKSYAPLDLSKLLDLSIFFMSKMAKCLMSCQIAYNLATSSSSSAKNLKRENSTTTQRVRISKTAKILLQLQKCN